MTVHQFHAVLSAASAVSNEVFALQRWLQSKGHWGRLFAEQEGSIEGNAVTRWSASMVQPEDLLLIHYSRGSDLHDSVLAAQCSKALIFHDVTPARFFADTDRELREHAEAGVASLARYNPSVRSAVAHSEFSANVLHGAGFKNVDVLPYVLNESLYMRTPDAATIQAFSGRKQSILLVVGRIAPNKCLEDCLFIADYLHRVLGLDYRLIFAGSAKGTEVYRQKLEQLCAQLELQDVEFTGEISQERMLALYRVSDGLLLMSEHEGFGVPLVEAMRFDVPIFAYAAGAVPEVLGDSGVLFEQKNWAAMAEAIVRVIVNPGLQEHILEAQRARYTQLAPEAVLPRWDRWIQQLAQS